MKALLGLIGLIVVFSFACAQAPPGGGAPPAATKPPASSIEPGKQLFTSKGCIACHVVKDVPGATGTIGPPLDGIGDAAKQPKIAGDRLDNNTENLKKWLANPPAIKPDTPMPNLSLTPAEIDSLVAFLQTLK